MEGVGRSRWLGVVGSLGRARRPRLRVVPAVSVPGGELVHLGGGESVPCPDAPLLPLASDARRTGLGSPSLALPAVRVHALRDVVVHPSCGLVMRDGDAVSESLPPDPDERAALAVPERRGVPTRLPGTVAVYRSGPRTRFHTLIEDFPRAALLAHPAMRRFGPVTLLHDGPLDPLEAWLLPKLVGRHVTVRSVDPATPLVADRVLVPAPVHRPGAGAVPSWYRRWADRATDGTHADLPRRLLLATAGDLDGVANRAELEAVAAELGLAVVDPTMVDPDELVSLCRDAEVVVGLSRAALAHAVFSRRARVVELLRGPTLSPAIYYLAMSKGLPYDYVATPVESGAAPGPVDVDAVRRLLA